MREKRFWCFIALCLLGGVFGLQEFYREKYLLGILAVLFCWTGIPWFVAYIEALVWLFKGENEFDTKYAMLWENTK